MVHSLEIYLSYYFLTFTFKTFFLKIKQLSKPPRKTENFVSRSILARQQSVCCFIENLNQSTTSYLLASYLLHAPEKLKNKVIIRWGKQPHYVLVGRKSELELTRLYDAWHGFLSLTCHNIIIACLKLLYVLLILVNQYSHFSCFRILA